MDVKEKLQNALDKWAEFKSNPVKTHAACAFAGLIIGVALAYK